MDITTLALCKNLINEVTSNAPEALATLKEIQDWITKNNKQADWEQQDSAAVDFIKNKPDLKGAGDVNFASFKVVDGRLKMYSDPTVDKVRFARKGSRLYYKLDF